MAMMLSKTYDALRDAGASDEKAQAAAEEIASFENRLASLDADMRLLKWMVGINLTATIGILLRLLSS